MTTKFATTIMGSLIITLTCSAVASAGGQLFVTGWDTPIKRLDSQTFELLGEISANPNHGQLCCDIQIDSYHHSIWSGIDTIYDFDGNLLVDGETSGAPYNSSVDPISNTLWILNPGSLQRETYDRTNIVQRTDAYVPNLNAGPSEKNITSSGDDVFFRMGNAIYSLNGPLVELPFTMFDLDVRTVKDGNLYFAYRPSTTAGFDFFRVRVDGSGLEQLSGGTHRVTSFDVDPDTETIYYVGDERGPDALSWSLYALNFGESTPSLICEDCAYDVDFVADDEWYLPGDTDLDHDIDLSDYSALASNFNPELEHSGFEWVVKTVHHGDFNGDWKIDLSDYNTLASNFSPAGYTGMFGKTSLSEVPEPSAVVLASLALVFWGSSRGLSKSRFSKRV